MPLVMVQGDITTISADAIVNAANTNLLPGGGVCGAIFEKAGYKALHAACRKIGYCETGMSVITPAFALPARYVIHTAGPIWHGGNQQEEKLLRSCYQTAMGLAISQNCESIAFPLISAGIYGYPKTQALKVAMQTIRDFLQTHELQVTLVFLDRTAFSEYRAQITPLKMALQDEKNPEAALAMPELTLQHKKENHALEQLMQEHMEETFMQMVLRLVDEKGMTDSETYKRANLDRRTFSKLRSTKNYMPKRQTAIALAIALQLNLTQTQELLGKAGYHLSCSNTFDLIVRFFISQKQYDIYEINACLFAYNQPLLPA